MAARTLQSSPRILPLYVRSAFRNYNTPVSRYLNLGFRVARSD